MNRSIPCALAALLTLGLAAPVLAQADSNSTAPAPAAAPAPSVDLNPIRSLVLSSRFKDALPLADAAVKADPNSAAAHDIYGQALLGAEKPDDAIREFTAATTLDAKNTTAFIHLGDAQMARYMVSLRNWLKDHSHDMVGRIHSDIPTVLAGPPGGPNSILQDDQLINDRSASQMNGKEWEKFEKIAKAASAAYNQALTLDAGNRKAMQGKGLAALVTGDWKVTEDLFRKGGVPAFDSFLYELARSVYDSHSMGGPSISIWEMASNADPTNPWAYWYLRQLYDEFHHSDWRYDYYDGMRMTYADRIVNESDAHRPSLKDAMKALQGVAEKHADFAPVWRGIGITALRMKDQKQAEAAFARAAELDPNDWFSQLQTGVAQMNHKDTVSAQKSLALAAKANPDDAVAWHALGRAAEANKDLDSAVSYYERATEIAPTWAQPQFDLGALLLDRRMGAEALPHLQRFLELKPDAPEAKDVRKSIEQLKTILASQ